MNNFNPEKANETEITVNRIDELISEFEKNDKISYADYKKFEEQLNQLQKGIDGIELTKFESRMKAIFEKVTDKLE